MLLAGNHNPSFTEFLGTLQCLLLDKVQTEVYGYHPLEHTFRRQKLIVTVCCSEYSLVDVARTNSDMFSPDGGNC